MLSMQMKSGDYITIGNNVIVQVFKESGPQFRISIKAPREIPIVRGKVLERSGNERPEGLRDKGVKKSPSDMRHAAIQRQKRLERQKERRERAQELDTAMGEMTGILDNMAESPALREEVNALRAQLERIARASEEVREMGKVSDTGE